MTEEKIDVLHAVTSSLSLVLMRGQLAYLRGAGFRPAALCGPGSHVQDLRAKESIPVFTIEMQREVAPLQDLVSLLQIWRLLRRVRPIICNVGTPKAGLLVGLAAWLCRVPCRVYTMRGLRLETATGMRRTILHFTERIACGCAHRVLCVSPSLRQRALELKLLPARKALVLASGSSNGVDPSRFAPTPERLADAAKLRAQLGIASPSQVIGYVGRVTRDKGVPELVAAFRAVQEQFPDAVLLLIGDVEQGDPIPPETREALDNARGIVRVDFQSDITPYYLLMDILALPTHREGFPNTVLEAQAAELPVVTTDATGAVDSIAPNVTGLLIPAGDAGALAEALTKLLSDRERARQMGAAGRARVGQQFRPEVVWKSLAELYGELLRERGLAMPVSDKSEAAICRERC
jgi:glycosyltransferase involved in cell wall biosynthesis